MNDWKVVSNHEKIFVFKFKTKNLYIAKMLIIYDLLYLVVKFKIDFFFLNHNNNNNQW